MFLDKIQKNVKTCQETSKEDKIRTQNQAMSGRPGAILCKTSEIRIKIYLDIFSII